MRFDRISGLLELVRWQGRGLRGDPSAVRGVLESCYVGLEVGIPADFILTGLCVLDDAAKRMGATSDSARSDFPNICEYGRSVDAENKAALEQIAGRLDFLRVPTESALLLGDAAVLLGLFGSTCAFRAQTWAIGVPGHAPDPDESVTDQAVLALPFEIKFGRLSRLEHLLDERTALVEAVGSKWRVPGPELMIVFMAARVGEPEASPASNTWAHLAAALKGLRGELDVDAVFALAEELEMSGRVHRGLAIVLVLFPELSVVIKSSRLDIPAWEKMALRLAANKILKVAAAEDE